MIYIIVCMILFRAMDGKVLDVCKDCKTAEEGSYLCWKTATTNAELIGTCKVRRLETRGNMLVRSMDVKAETVIFQRTSLKCQDIQADYAILQGRICVSFILLYVFV